MVAEIGEVSRFKTAAQLASWAGLTLRHRESDIKVIRGHVTKQGSRQLRWALIEAVQHQPAGSRPGRTRDAILARRGRQARNIAKVAAARELLALVFYGLRDGQVRAVATPSSASAAHRRAGAGGMNGPLAHGRAAGRLFVCPPPAPAARTSS
jgi:hypothetical protein